MAAYVVNCSDMLLQILLMRDVLWNDYPLQHFTLQKNSEVGSRQLLYECNHHADDLSCLKRWTPMAGVCLFSL